MTPPHRSGAPRRPPAKTAASKAKGAPGDLPPARAAALESLARAFPGQGRPGRGMDIQAALDAVLAGRNLDPRDAALASELVYGHARLRGRTEFLVSRLLKNPAGLPPPVFAALTLAAHEILHLDRVPAYASVDWAVSRIKALSGARLAGVANAVLRRLADEAARGLGMDACRTPGAATATVWSRHYSCPAWIVELWRKAYGGAAAERFLAAQAAAPPMGLRVNMRRPGATGLFERLAALPGVPLAAPPTLAFAPGADLAAAGFDLEAAQAHGLVSRQSAAAQRVLADLDPPGWPGPVFDACAGRGGKTAHLLEATDHTVWAADVHRGRLRALGRELVRLGLPPIPVFAASGTRPPLKKRPGTILLDAPCSGLGVLSRRPDAKWKRAPDDLADLARLQDGLLRAAWDVLAPGGLLVYVTCTLAPEENQGRVDRLLVENPGARLATRVDPDPASPLGEFFFAASVRKPG
ncbi:MAG: RNA methyltransferase RsmF [Desulfovibrio sp.]|nr:RNA methyltransferase RsmF [Desulfovibrio sp.]